MTSILFVILLATGCESSKQADNDKVLTYADSLWIEFYFALKTENLNYLIENSLDTIQCAECDISIQNEYHKSEFIFKNHINQLIHLNSLKGKEFSSFQDHEVIHITYFIYSKNAEENGYNLIFTFIQTKDGFKFKGMIVT